MLKGLQITEEIGSGREKEIISNQFTLKHLLEKDEGFQLRIPLYQRLYVWGNEEIARFLEDIADAYVEERENYFIGNMMFAVTSVDGSFTIDLIDGQQRFTTLWLVSIILKRYSFDNLAKFAFYKNKPRLSFSSRPEANEFFSSLGEDDVSFDLLSSEENFNFGKSNNEIEPLTKGLRNISEKLRDLKNNFKWNDNSLKDFTKYIFEKLIMVQTTVPTNINLNQIFESLNSGGKQLENHQILKARLFRVLRDSKQFKEAELEILAYKWDACSDMSIYIERSVYAVSNNNWKNVIAENINNKNCTEVESPNIFFKLNTEEFKDGTIEKRKLLDIIKDLEDADKSTSKGGKTSPSVKSIVSFSQFLLHCLRIYYLKNDIKNPIKVDSENLLIYFNTKDVVFSKPENVKEFIELVFDLRFLFDKYVVKRTSEDGNEEADTLLINKIYVSEDKKDNLSVGRKLVKENQRLSLLQSMFYIVQEQKTQYWLTPFLNYLYNEINKTNDKFERDYSKSINACVDYLEKLDLYFYCQNNKEFVMKDLSFVDSDEFLKFNKYGDWNFVSEELKRFKGTLFFRYWFYKTEYLLWVNRGKYDFLNGKEKELWDNFSMTFKNSIEHIYPQSAIEPFGNDEERKEYPEGIILRNYLGNLVLLTVSENSEYGKKDSAEKWQIYKNNLSFNRIDSLKSSLIFDLVSTKSKENWWNDIEGIWNFTKAKYHLEKQIMPLYEKQLSSDTNDGSPDQV